MLARFILAVIAAAELGISVHSQQPVTPWPPPGVLRVADVDTPPRAIKRIAPESTAEAQRAGIQGVVGLSCVVNADGTVGDVRVTRSLDALHGLDDAAVAAAKQWQYSPAIKDGKPVPVVVNVEMSFTLGGKDTSPDFTWPAGFDLPTPGTGWKTMDLESRETRLHVEYPDSWTVRRDASPRELVTIQTPDSIATVVIEPLTVSTGSYSRPFSPEQLRSIADKMTPAARGFGQVAAEGRIWIWAELATPNGISTWRFQTIADDVAVNIVMTLRGAREDLAAQLGSMLRRMTVKSKL
jgi:TonB family protein